MSRLEYKHWCRNCGNPIQEDHKVNLVELIQMFEAHVGFAEHVERSLNMCEGNIDDMYEYFLCMGCALDIIEEFNKTLAGDPNKALLGFQALVDYVITDYAEVILEGIEEAEQNPGPVPTITKDEVFRGLYFLTSLADVNGLANTAKKWRKHVDRLKYGYGWSDSH